MFYGYLIVIVWIIWRSGRPMLRPAFFSGLATALVVVALYMPVVIAMGAGKLLWNPWVAQFP